MTRYSSGRDLKCENQPNFASGSFSDFSLFIVSRVVKMGRFDCMASTYSSYRVLRYVRGRYTR